MKRPDPIAQEPRETLTLICPKTEKVCQYGLRQLDEQLCVWCGQISEIRENRIPAPRRRGRPRL